MIPFIILMILLQNHQLIILLLNPMSLIPILLLLKNPFRHLEDPWDRYTSQENIKTFTSHIHHQFLPVTLQILAYTLSVLYFPIADCLLLITMLSYLSHNKLSLSHIVKPRKILIGLKPWILRLTHWSAITNRFLLTFHNTRLPLDVSGYTRSNTGLMDP